ncbi:MAG TPA: CCA tRNA nucleotidyltransferase [Candidatus Eisenbacteria bacterium]|nr:CCA tRNA nucleotidyltransferase [Candidatus Eisenbacteria bacterium]
MSLRPLNPKLVPPAFLNCARTLRERGHLAYFVGGCVRDLLRGVAVADWDIATSARPEQLLSIFSNAVPTGLKHGTVTVPTPSGPCEITTFRVESGYTDARHPDRVEFVTDVTQDLARRDFTVNAIAWDPLDKREEDPFGGRSDLTARVIRAVGDARERFREDGLRPVRAARFTATLEFDLDPDTEAALGDARDQVARVAPERIREELVKMLAAPQPSRGLEVLRRAGLLPLVLPELAQCVAVPQNRYHAYDVYYHTLHTVDAAPADKPAVRLAALFHDVGKPPTRVERNGDATFYNHQFEGERLAVEAMTRLRFSREATEEVAHLVRNHMFDYRPEWSDAAVRRFLQKVGTDHVADLFDLRIADNIGNGTKTGFPHYLEELRGRIEQVLEARQALTLKDLKIDGGDVMQELGIPPGRKVGAILERLLDEVLEDPGLNERGRLLRRVREAFSVDRARA